MPSGSSNQKGGWVKGTFGVDRVEKGRVPAGVDTCPVGALRFGDTDDEGSPISKFIATHDTFKLLDDLGTDPSVVYAGGTAPSSEAREIERPMTGVDR